MPSDPLQPVSYLLALHSTVATHLVRLAISHFFPTWRLVDALETADLAIMTPSALCSVEGDGFERLRFLLVLVPEGERLSEPLPKGPRSVDIRELPLVTCDLVAVLKKGIKEGNR